MAKPKPITPTLLGVTEVRLNVLEIVLDDLGRERDEAYQGDAGILGVVPPSEVISTPNMRRLYQSGVRFRRARTQPWCSPSRAAGITGRWAFRTGITNLAEGASQPLLLDEMCLPRALKLGTGGAVSTALFGKHHLATKANGWVNHPNLMGFDYFAGTMTNLDTSERNYFQWDKVEQGSIKREYEYPEDVIVRDALKWIAGQGGSQWYCKVAFHLPHQIEHRPPSEYYDSSKYVLKAQMPSAGEDPRLYHAAMIQAADFEVGKLLDGIPAGVLANTVVILWSDNGSNETMLPDVLQLAGAGSIYAGATPPANKSHAKRTVYDYGCRNPFVVSGAVVASPGRVSDVPISVVDIYRTVAQIMGADLTKAPSKNGHLDSISFLPNLVDPVVGAQRTFGFSELFTPNGANANAASSGIRATWDAQYKLIRTVAGITFPNGADEMYDTLADPNELVNLLPGGGTGSLTAPQLTAYNGLKNFFITTNATV